MSHPLEIHLSHRVPGKGAPSVFPNRIHIERDTSSPELMVYPFISASVPKQGAQRRWKAYIQWGVAWFPKGIVNDTAVFTPVPYSPRHNTFHLGLGRPEPH